MSSPEPAPPPDITGFPTLDQVIDDLARSGRSSALDRWRRALDQARSRPHELTPRDAALLQQLGDALDAGAALVTPLVNARRRRLETPER